MKTLTHLGAFGIVVIPIAIAILAIGTYFVAQIISQNINLY